MALCCILLYRKFYRPKKSNSMVLSNKNKNYCQARWRRVHNVGLLYILPSCYNVNIFYWQKPKTLKVSLAGSHVKHGGGGFMM